MRAPAKQGCGNLKSISKDGVNWSSADINVDAPPYSGTSSGLNNMVYGDGIFLATSNNGKFYVGYVTGNAYKLQVQNGTQPQSSIVVADAAKLINNGNITNECAKQLWSNII